MHFKTKSQLQRIWLIAALICFTASTAFAATEVIKTIREDGTGDYTSLAAWQEGERRDLVDQDEIAVAQIEGTWTNPETGPFIIQNWGANGYGTDTEHYIEVRAVGEARHSGVWSTTAYRMETVATANYPSSFGVWQAHVKVKGIQVKMDATYWNYGMIVEGGIWGKPDLLIDGCLLVGERNLGDFSYGGIYLNAGDSVVIRNTTIMGCGGTAGKAINVDMSSGTICSILNCTIVGNETGIRNGPGANTTVTNCVVINNTDDFNAHVSGTIAIDYCASDDGDGTNAIDFTAEATDWAANLVDYANGNFHLKTGSALIDAGADLSASGFSTDFEGETRGSGAWDIGADEYRVPDVTPPTVALTAPNGGQSWGTETSQNITWTAGDGESGISSCSLYYSLDGGTGWTAIAAVSGNPGTYAWTLPATVSSNALVRVVAINGDALSTSDQSDAVFTISDASAPTSAGVTAPAAGANLANGSTQTVSWTASDNVGLASCSLYYNVDDGAWNPITLVTGATTYDWTVSASVTSNAKIKAVIFDAAGNSAEAISGAFTVSQADLQNPTVSNVTLSPGGSTVEAGTQQVITWTEADDIGVVACTVLVTYDGGATWTALASVAAGTGQYSWQTDATTLAASCQIMVKAVDGVGKTGTGSSASFAMADLTAPTVTLNSPAGGDSWPGGSSQDITWTAADANGVSTYLVEFSEDNTTWSTIGSGSGDPGSQAWTVVEGPKKGCWIRVTVTDAAGNSASDINDMPFDINANPFFTSPESVTVAQNGVFSYALTYDLAGNPPGSDAFRYISTPSWVTVVGPSLMGSAPAVDRVDTAMAELTVGAFVDTLVIRIFIGNSEIRPIRTQKAPATFSFVPQVKSGHVEFVVGMQAPGHFELAVHDASGRLVLSHDAGFTHAGFHRIGWNNPARSARSGVYFATVINGTQRLQRRMILMR